LALILQSHPPRSALFPYTTLFRSRGGSSDAFGSERPTSSRCWTETWFGIQTLRCDASGGRRIPVPATDGFRAALHGHRTRVAGADRKSTRLNSSHVSKSYAVFRLK